MNVLPCIVACAVGVMIERLGYYRGRESMQAQRLDDAFAKASEILDELRKEKGGGK